MTIFYGTRYSRVPAIFSALSCASRRSILYLVALQPLSATQIADYVGISRQCVSKHLAVLQRAGLIERRGWQGYQVDAIAVNELTDFIDDHFRERRTR